MHLPSPGSDGLWYQRGVLGPIREVSGDESHWQELDFSESVSKVTSIHYLDCSHKLFADHAKCTFQVPEVMVCGISEVFWDPYERFLAMKVIGRSWIFQNQSSKSLQYTILKCSHKLFADHTKCTFQAPEVMVCGISEVFWDPYERFLAMKVIGRSWIFQNQSSKSPHCTMFNCSHRVFADRAKIISKVPEMVV
jgi:hypothetical protein